MKNIILLFLSALAIVSCSSSYNIKGTSDISMLDGHKLYLRALKKDKLTNIDSCEVVHGQFHFNGKIDTTQVGTIVLDNETLMPVVLEEGDIEMTINSSSQSCKGSLLNDKLSEFTEKYNQITNELADLEHQHYQAIMDGKDMEAVDRKLQERAAQLAVEEEKHITSFIEDNFDNVLGPFAFQIMTANMEVPMLEPWIQVLLTKASETFKNDAYVKEFISVAERNQAIMTGMEDEMDPPHTAPTQQPVNPAITPNELAQPEKMQ